MTMTASSDSDLEYLKSLGDMTDASAIRAALKIARRIMEIQNNPDSKLIERTNDKNDIELIFITWHFCYLKL